MLICTTMLFVFSLNKVAVVGKKKVVTSYRARRKVSPNTQLSQSCLLNLTRHSVKR